MAALLDQYTAIRAALVTAMGTAWSGILCIKAQDSLERPGEFYRINIDGPVEIGGDNGTPTTEEALFSFEIVGRFTLASGGDAELLAITKGSAARSALIALDNPGSVGYLPKVSMVDPTPMEPGDNRYDVRLSYSVRAVVDRS